MKTIKANNQIDFDSKLKEYLDIKSEFDKLKSKMDLIKDGLKAEYDNALKDLGNLKIEGESGAYVKLTLSDRTQFLTSKFKLDQPNLYKLYTENKPVTTLSIGIDKLK